jgi:hypothetical protein
VDIGTHSLAVQGLQRLASDLSRYASRSDVEIRHIPLPCHLDVPFTDFDHVERMISDAYSMSRKILAGSSPQAAWFHRPSFKVK